MTNFRNFLTVSVLALLFTFTLASCKKDGVDLPSPTPNTENTNTGNNGTTTRSMEDDMDEMDDLCFDFVYPITVQLPDGEQQTANDDTELENIIENYYLANPTSEEDPTLVFPVDVIDGETGEQISLQDEDELFFLFEMCFDYEEGLCFEINYPVTVVFPDGSTQEVNNDDELYTTFDTWYENNPMSDEDPTFEYPINVTDEAGETITVNSDEELEELFDACYEDWDEEIYDLCFDIVFPITINLPDGSTAEANDYEEMETIFFDWFENNPSSEEFPTVAYPIQVELEDGTIVDVNGDEEIEALYEECEDFDEDWSDCFTFNYPITVVFPDATTADVNNDDELEEAVYSWYEANPMSEEDPTLQFPLDVTTAEGEVLTINSEEELEELFEECFDCLIVNAGELAAGSGQSTMTEAIVKQHSKVETAKKKSMAKALKKN